MDYEKESRSGENVNWHLLDEKGYRFEEIKLTNCTAKLLINNKNENSSKVLIMLHGGDYYQGLEDKYLVMAENFSKANNDSKVLVVDFRLAPKNLFPAALNDSVEAYEYLLNNGYKAENIVIGGDSSGGGLTIATALYLKENKKELPKALITLSAVTNFDPGYKGDSEEKNKDVDVMLGSFINDDLIKPIFAGKESLKNPYISPMLGNLSGLPQIYMQVASHEVLLSNTVDFAEKAKRQGVKVKYDIYYGLFHVFQIAPDIPESQTAWKDIAKFLKEVYSK